MIARVGLAVFLASVLVPLPAAERLSEPMPARNGETCLVCNQAVGETDVAYLAGGQRVAMHATDQCEGEFLKRPAEYMAKLRPNDILFSHVANLGVSGVWLWPGLYVLAGLVSGSLCAHKAVQKGRPPLRWFLAGFVFSVAAYVAVCLAAPTAKSAAVPAGFRKVPLTRDPVPCAACGRQNHPAAERCADCGAALVPLVQSEVSAVRSS